MELEVFLNEVVNTLNIGRITEKPVSVPGGFMHKVYKLTTDKGQYIIKLLNPNIMSSGDAMSNYTNLEELEKILKQNNIPAIYSLEFDQNLMQEINGQYFYLYDWYNGVSLKNNEITKEACYKIGQILSSIHNIDLKQEAFFKDRINIDFNEYIKIAKETDSLIYPMLGENRNLLNKVLEKGNESLGIMPSTLSICHNDMDSKNVLWFNDDCRIIDLEALGYSSPYLELFDLALSWSGHNQGKLDYTLFNSFLEGYFENARLNINIDWEIIYNCNFEKLFWLEFNVKRALMISCNTKEEQEIGISQVKRSLRIIDHDDKTKDEILSIINDYKIKKTISMND